MPQFQKGQSGNPAGRPPGSRNRATVMVQNLLDEGAAYKDAPSVPPRGGKDMGGFHLSVLAPVMSLFGECRDSPFVNPFK